MSAVQRGRQSPNVESPVSVRGGLPGAARPKAPARGSRPLRWGPSGDPLLHGIDAVPDYSGKSHVLRTCADATPVCQRSSGDVEVLGELGRRKELRQLLGGCFCPWHGSLQSSWALGWRPRLCPVGGRFLSRAIPARHMPLPPMTDVDASTMWTMPVPIPQPHYRAHPKASSIFGAFRGPQGARRDE